MPVKTAQGPFFPTLPTLILLVLHCANIYQGSVVCQKLFQNQKVKVWPYLIFNVKRVLLSIQLPQHPPLHPDIYLCILLAFSSPFLKEGTALYSSILLSLCCGLNSLLSPLMSGTISFLHFNLFSHPLPSTGLFLSLIDKGFPIWKQIFPILCYPYQ